MPREEGEHKWTIMARQMESGTLSAIKANSPPFCTQADFFSIIARLHGSSDTLVLALPISKQARWCRGDEGMGALWFPCFSVKWRDKKHHYYKPRKPCRFWRQGVVDWGESQRERSSYLRDSGRRRPFVSSYRQSMCSPSGWVFIPDQVSSSSEW